MAKFYATAGSKMVTLTATDLFHAELEANEIAKTNNFVIDQVRPFVNGKNEPETLSKGNILRPHQQQNKKKLKKKG